MSKKQRRPMQSNARGAPAPIRDPAIVRDFNDAVQLLRAGRFDESEVAHRRVLAKLPRHAPSLHHLGLIAFKNKALDQAVDYIRQSLKIEPNDHQAWRNLGLVLAEARRLEEALDACRRSVAIRPTDARSHAALGDLLRIARSKVDAVGAYHESLKLEPKQPAVLTRLAEIMLQSGDATDALSLCRRALALDPALAEAKALERRILASYGELGDAQAAIDAQSSDPVERARALDELAGYLRAQKRFDEAVSVQRRALSCAPDRADYHFNLALALEGAGQNQAALSAFQAGLAIEPDRAVAYKDVGSLLRKMNMHKGAVTAFEHAAKLDPGLADAHYNLATTLKLMGRFEEAREAFRRAIDTAPDSLTHYFELSNLRRQICDWDGIDEEERYCLELMRKTKRGGVPPFLLISMPEASPADQLEAAKRFAQFKAAPEEMKFRSHPKAAPSDRRIRIGYLSADFITHATAQLLAEVLEKTDRERFELFGYCYSLDDGSEMRRRLIRSFDRFVDINPMTDFEAAKVIHEDGIDILVDLKGYTRHARTEIVGFRPAPIQVNYLGYPGTMGADFIDYIVADAVIAPMQHQEHYSERIVHLPNCYQPNDRQRRISDEPLTRAEFGLPEGAFVFCSFNNSYKLISDVFDVWMRLLDRVQGSVLWIIVDDNGGRDNLRREAAARGIDPARLVFADRMPIERHLARHRLADLFLDTVPCNAHTTASDALWAGLPVLTCIGETFSGRVAASLLSAMNLGELIAGDLAEYERIALELAGDRGKLAALRRKIEAECGTSPLFDSERYTRNLERAYQTMVDLMRAGQAPQAFAVVEERPGIAQLTSNATQTADARVPYEQCPVCDAADIPYQIEARLTEHPAYKPDLPPTVKWRSCADCGHIFTEGYFNPAAREIVLSTMQPHQEIGRDADAQRLVSSRIVERVARYAPSGEWLDIGVGNGSLLFTAAEWGYQAAGADMRIESVEVLLKLGFKAYWSDVEDIKASDRYNVVSMSMLPQTPFPRRALAALHRMMRSGGVLLLSAPNMDTIVWRILDASGANPYWGELENNHVFTRSQLMKLLEEQGFRFAEYNISERAPSAMEIIAIKA